MKQINSVNENDSVTFSYNSYSLTEARNIITEYVTERLTAAGLSIADIKERVDQLPLTKDTRPELWAKICNTPLQVTDEELKSALNLK